MPIASALQKALEDAQAQSLSSNRQVWIWKAGDKYIPTLGDKPEGSSLMGRVIGEEGVKPQLYAGAAGVVGGGGCAGGLRSSAMYSARAVSIGTSTMKWSASENMPG